MDELVDLLDENGNYTGKSELKSVAHKKGLFHPTVHVWCYSPDGDVLLQQRGKNKEIFPSKWDVSVAGHVGSGENLLEAAIREVHEEIGVTIDKTQLETIGVFKTEKRHSETLWDREFNHTYLARLSADKKLIKQESEVEALLWMPLKEFEAMVLKDDEKFVPNSRERYLMVIAAIKSRI